MNNKYYKSISERFYYSTSDKKSYMIDVERCKLVSIDKEDIKPLNNKVEIEEKEYHFQLLKLLNYFL